MTFTRHLRADTTSQRNLQHLLGCRMQGWIVTSLQHSWMPCCFPCTSISSYSESIISFNWDGPSATSLTRALRPSGEGQEEREVGSQMVPAVQRCPDA